MPAQITESERRLERPDCRTALLQRPGSTSVKAFSAVASSANVQATDARVSAFQPRLPLLELVLGRSRTCVHFGSANISLSRNTIQHAARNTTAAPSTTKYGGHPSTPTPSFFDNPKHRNLRLLQCCYACHGIQRLRSPWFGMDQKA